MENTSWTQILPKQAVPGYSPESQNENEVLPLSDSLKKFRAAIEKHGLDGKVNEGEGSRKKKMKKADLFLGGQEESLTDCEVESAYNFKDYYHKSNPKQQFALRCKQLTLNKTNVAQYFTEKSICTSFGIAAPVKLRVGRDGYETWRLYLKRENGANASPSILGLCYAEVDEILAHLESLLAKIDAGLQSGDIYLRPADLNKFKLEKPDNIEFWENPNVWSSGTSSLRIRAVWQFSNNYQIIINVPVAGSSFEKFFGPRIILGVREVEQFIDKARALQALLPDWEELD